MTHIVSLCYSDDGGENYSRRKEREKGSTGTFLKELKWEMLGQTRERVWEFCDSSNVSADVLSASMIIEAE